MCCLKKAATSLKAVEKKVFKMYSKEEQAAIKRDFWTAYGKYMMPVPGADGDNRNWVNYKTGVKNIFFKPDFTRQSARVSVVVNHSDEAMRQRFFNQFLQLRPLFDAVVGAGWQWMFNKDEGSIALQLEGPDIFKRNDWPAAISFLKEQMILLDAFWEDVKPVFEGLR